jgi:hypothetical protein
MTRKVSIFLTLLLPAIGFSQWEDNIDVIVKNAETKELLNPTNFFSDLTNLTPIVIYKDYEIIDLRN